MPERSFVTFSPIPAPNGLLVTVAATNIIALKKNNQPKYWILLDSGTEYEINLATYTLLKSQIDTHP